MTQWIRRDRVTRVEAARALFAHYAAWGIVLGFVLGSSEAFAQAPGCTKAVIDDPRREVLRCVDGLKITAEQGADYHLIVGRSGDELPEALELRNQGLLIELAPDRGRIKGFQILTPHAVASVRGTTWIVDVANSATAVFVISGAVRVGRKGSHQVVNLRTGEGIDVAPGDEVLQARRWKRPRVKGLLARFGL